MSAPHITTARLTLRGHRFADFPDCRAMWADPVVTRYISGKPSTDQQTWLRLLSFVGLWSILGFGYWVVEDRSSGLFVGEIGFADFKRDIEPEMKDVPELGWAFAAQFHGQGYATEATRAATTWGDEHLGSARTVCLIDPANIASLRVAHKSGYVEFKRTMLSETPVICLERPGPGDAFQTRDFSHASTPDSVENGKAPMTDGSREPCSNAGEPI